MKRANVLVAAGIVLVVIGVVVAWQLGGGDDAAAPDPTVQVVVAKADLEPGEAGSDLVADGKVGVEEVPRSEAASGSVGSTDQLDGAVVSAEVPEGDQVPLSALRSEVLRGDAIAIPDDHQALAVTVPFTAGGAGYAGPGDRVNVYATIPPGTDGAEISPFTRLLLSDIEVLDVSEEVAPRRSEVATASDESTPTTQSPRSTADQLTLLIAVDARQAEQVVFAASVNQLWFTVVPEDQGPTLTPGVGYGRGYVEGG